MAEPIVVEGPDGREFEFPADTPNDVMKSAMASQYPTDNWPKKLLGMQVPGMEQMGQNMEDARARDVASQARVREVGQAEQDYRARAFASPFSRRTDRISTPQNLTGADQPNLTPESDLDKLGAYALGADQGLTFGFGDELSGSYSDYDKRTAERDNPQDYATGEMGGMIMNAGATLPLTVPRTLNAARFLPLGPRAQSAASGAMSASVWDGLYQLGEGQGDAVERVSGMDPQRTGVAAGIGAGLGGLLGIIANPLSKEGSEFARVLDTVVDDGGVSDDGVRALERFLRDKGIALDDVTLGRINGVIKDARESGSKSLALPVRIKDVLVDALDGGSGKIRDALKNQLRGTMGMGDEGATTIQKAIDEDYVSSRQAAYDQYGNRLGQRRRIDSEDKTLSELRKIGEEGYEPILSQGPQTYQGARALDEVLNGPGMRSGELMSPMRQYANAEGFELEDFIKSQPLRAAHWMQSKARELVDSGQKQYSGLRTRLLGAIEEAAPNYNAVRAKYGDEYGNLEALDFGDKFLTNAGKEFEIDKMARAYKELSAAQKRVALLSVRDVLRTATGKGKKSVPPRLTRVGQEQVLEALETVFGKRGARVAQDIEKIEDFLKLRSDVDVRGRGSQTTPLAQDIQTATNNVSPPWRRKLGGALQGVAGDAVLTASGFGPLNAVRRGVSKAGEIISGDPSNKMNAFAKLLEAKISPAQTKPQRTLPQRGPDGKFIAANKNALSAAEVPAAPAEAGQRNALAKPPAQSGFIPPALTEPVGGAVVGGGAGSVFDIDGDGVAGTPEDRGLGVLLGLSGGFASKGLRGRRRLGGADADAGADNYLRSFKTSGGSNVDVLFAPKYGGKHLEVDMRVDGSPYRKTGSAVRPMAEVQDILAGTEDRIRQVVSSTQPEQITFSATTKARANLYNRLIKNGGLDGYQVRKKGKYTIILERVRPSQSAPAKPPVQSGIPNIGNRHGIAGAVLGGTMAQDVDGDGRVSPQERLLQSAAGAAGLKALNGGPVRRALQRRQRAEAHGIRPSMMSESRLPNELDERFVSEAIGDAQLKKNVPFHEPVIARLKGDDLNRVADDMVSGDPQAFSPIAQGIEQRLAAAKASGTKPDVKPWERAVLRAYKRFSRDMNVNGFEPDPVARRRSYQLREQMLTPGEKSNHVSLEGPHITGIKGIGPDARQFDSFNNTARLLMASGAAGAYGLAKGGEAIWNGIPDEMKENSQVLQDADRLGRFASQTGKNALAAVGIGGGAPKPEPMVDYSSIQMKEYLEGRGLTVEQFQYIKRLPETGRLDAATYEALTLEMMNDSVEGQGLR